MADTVASCGFRRVIMNSQVYVWFMAFLNGCFIALLLIMLVVMELRLLYKAFLLASIVVWSLFIIMLFISIIKRDNIIIHLLLIFHQICIIIAATAALTIFLVLAIALEVKYTYEELASVLTTAFAGYVVEISSFIMLLARYRQLKKQQSPIADGNGISTVQFERAREMVNIKMFMPPPPYSSLPPDVLPPRTV